MKLYSTIEEYEQQRQLATYNEPCVRNEYFYALSYDIIPFKKMKLLFVVWEMIFLE